MEREALELEVKVCTTENAIKTIIAESMYAESVAFYSKTRYTPERAEDESTARRDVLEMMPIREVIAVQFTAWHDSITGDSLQDQVIEMIQSTVGESDRIERDSESEQMFIYTDVPFSHRVEAVLDELGIDAHKSILENPHPRGLGNWNEACKFLGVSMPRERVGV